MPPVSATRRWSPLALVLSVWISGCSGREASHGTSPTGAAADFEQVVLADGVVSADEWREAKQLVVDCMSARGWSFAYRADDSAVLQVPDGKNQKAADRDYDECSAKTTRVEVAWSHQKDVARGIPDAQRFMIDCLYQQGAVPNTSPTPAEMEAATKLPTFAVCIKSLESKRSGSVP